MSLVNWALWEGWFQETFLKHLQKSDCSDLSNGKIEVAKDSRVEMSHAAALSLASDP